MKIFLAVSFTSKVDNEGNVNAAYRSDIEALIQKLEEENYEVYCALPSENWKINNQNPIMLLRSELKNLDDADIFVAVLDKTISAGVQLSTGYALANKKRIIQASIIGTKLGWANNALAGFENISSVNFEFYDELGAQLHELIRR